MGLILSLVITFFNFMLERKRQKGQYPHEVKSQKLEIQVKIYNPQLNNDKQRTTTEPVLEGEKERRRAILRKKLLQKDSKTKLYSRKAELSAYGNTDSIEIQFPDGSVFSVEYPANFTVQDLLHEIARYFNLNPQLWSLCSSDGEIFSDSEIVQSISHKEQAIVVPKGKLA